MNVLGIDPGMAGGLAYVSDHHAEAVPMPLSGKEIDVRGIVDILRTKGVELVVIERSQPMRREGRTQGVTSAFRYGMGFGLILGALEALSVPYRLVTPQQWKKLVLEGTAKDKDAAIAFVRRAYPGVSLVLPRCRVAHDGMADALCIADYGRRAYGSG